MNFSKETRKIKRARKIFQILNLPQQGKILDVSCGDGYLLKIIEKQFPNLELYGVDISQDFQDQEIKRSKINFKTADATSLPFEDNYFDVAICALSIHHYENISGALRDISRVLKPSGQIYLIDFMTKSAWAQFLLNLIGCHEPYHFEKFYREDELIALCKVADLNYKSKTSISTLPKIEALQFFK